LALLLLDSSTPAPISSEDPVSSPKRPLLLFALAAILFVGTTSTSEAQGFRRGGPTRVVVVGGYSYSPFWYGDPLYGFQYPFGPYGPYPYRGVYRLDPGAAVRLDVTPKQAEVYVDGYYAGVVDDFNGTFQRLRVEPGEHEIELYLDGYRTVKQKVYLQPDNTFKIKYTMEKLAAGDQAEPRPQPVNPPPPPQAGGQPAPMQGPRTRGPATRRMPPPPPQDPRGQGDPRGQADPRVGPPTGANGTIAVRVQPADAEVSIDGEPWRSPGGQERLLIDLPEGSHTVEVRKPGFRTYVTQVEVRRGETTPLNVSLRGDQ
jgi:PEGA domain